MKLSEFLSCIHDLECNSAMTRLYCVKCGQDANVIDHVKKQQAKIDELKEDLKYVLDNIYEENFDSIREKHEFTKR